MKIHRIAHLKVLLFAALAVGMLILLNACTTSYTKTPRQIYGFNYQESGQMSYLWTAGVIGVVPFGLPDYAIIVKIDDKKIPEQYLPPLKLAPVSSRLIVIPAGKHTLRMIYKEAHITARGTFDGVPTAKIRAEKDIVLYAEPDRIYAPFADDRCFKDWFWVEDRGPYRPGSAAAGMVKYSDQTKPVVAGERPDKVLCN